MHAKSESIVSKEITWFLWTLFPYYRKPPSKYTFDGNMAGTAARGGRRYWHPLENAGFSNLYGINPERAILLENFLPISGNCCRMFLDTPIGTCGLTV